MAFRRKASAALHWCARQRALRGFLSPLMVATPLRYVIQRARADLVPRVPAWSAQWLLAAKRSSIKSRSTSQYLSDDRRSLSVSSAWAESSPFMIFGRNPSERLLACCDLRLDFDVRQRLRSFRALPINNPLSGMLLSGTSHHGLGAVVRNRSAPSPVFNSGGDGKFHEHRQSFSFSRTRRWPYQQDVRLEKKITQRTEIQSCERFTRVSSDI